VIGLGEGSKKRVGKMRAKNKNKNKKMENLKKKNKKQSRFGSRWCC